MGGSLKALGAALVPLLVILLAWMFLGGGGDSGQNEAADPAPGPLSSPSPADDGQPSEVNGNGEDTADVASGAVGTDTRDWDDIDACADPDLPPELAPVIDDITVGGPYDYGKDGSTFGNYEGYLPDEHRGYYREFTVETPGLDHRGAKRIVTGGDQETDPEVWYYTDDHYESFCEFAPAG